MARAGAKKKPYYRIVATNSRSPRDGRFIEQIGQYDPNTKPAMILIDQDRYAHWVKNGAQPSATVARLQRDLARRTRAAAK
jgi:small subunit ribosomal protein S16